MSVINIPQDNCGKPVLCYYNVSTKQYEPVNGSNGALNVNFPIPSAVPFAYSDVVTSITAKANNATVSITRAGAAGLSWYIGYMNYRVAGGTGGGSDIPIRVLDGSTLIYESNIAKTATEGSSNAVYPAQPIKITAGNSFTYSRGASGTTGTYIIINMGVFQR